MTTQQSGPTGGALKELRTALQALLVTLDEIDADDWGYETTRDLRTYARASLTDLDAGLLQAPMQAEARTRLGRVGSEAQLQQWAETWSTVPEWADTFARVQRAVAAALAQAA